MEQRTIWNKLNKTQNDKAGKLRLKEYAEKSGAVLTALLFWQLAAVLIDSNVLIAGPTDVLRRLAEIICEDDFIRIAAFTLGRIAAGYLAAVLTGMLLAFAAGRSRAAEILMRPWVISIRAIPVASMVVILLILVSSRNLSVIIVFLVVFPVVYTNILSGLKSCSRELAEMAAVFGITGMKKLRYVTMPQLKSYIISACSVTAGMAWKAGAAAEVIGTPPMSIGKMIYQSKTWLDTESLFAWTLVLIILSTIFEKVFIYLLKAVLYGRNGERNA